MVFETFFFFKIFPIHLTWSSVDFEMRYISETVRATGLIFWDYTKSPGGQMKNRSQGHSKVTGSNGGKYPNQTVHETRGHVRSLGQVR